MLMQIMKRAAFALSLTTAFTLSAKDYTLDFSGATALSPEAPVIRRAEMAVDVGTVPSVAVGDRLDLVLFGDVSFALKIVAAPPAGIAGQSFIARDENGSASAIVKVSKTSARISVDDFMNRRQYTVRCKDGKATIIERDNSQDDGGECGTCGGEIDAPLPVPSEDTATASSPARSRLLSSGTAFPVAEQKSVVDILVAFDKGAKAWAGNGSNWGNGGDSIEEFADYAVNKMNMVLEKSQLLDTFSYRLAGVTEVDATYTSIGNQLLGNLRERVGALSKLTQLREKCGADTITLLIDKTQENTTGIGYGYYPISSFPGPASFDRMNYACNVCDIKTVYSRYTMSHETGHNMGCDHSTRQGPDNSGPGRFDDSSGYHFVDANGVRRYTIMGYNYTADDDYYDYLPVPYFSSPDISPAEYGCAVGVEGTNNNRRTLLQTHGDIAGLREHVLPYDWDVHFLDSAGNEILKDTYFSTRIYVTLTNANSSATIYYTDDGTTPNTESSHAIELGAAVKLTITVDNPGDSKTITACAVIDGIAQSIRAITFTDAFTWSGEQGENGNGVWTSGDPNVLSWDNSTQFYNDYDAVVFPDLSNNATPVVTVKGAVSPVSAKFPAFDTSYTFAKGNDSAKITIPDEDFNPSGNVTFNVPVDLQAKSFRVADNKTYTFNAPFGPGATETEGTFNPDSAIVLGKNSGNATLTVAPGVGHTQTFSTFTNVTYFWSSSQFNVGKGTVVFTADGNGRGLFGSLQITVGDGGTLVFNGNNSLADNSKDNIVNIESGGEIICKGLEQFRRRLNLKGGTLTVAGGLNGGRAFELYNAPSISVSADSAFNSSNLNTQTPYVFLNGGSPTFTFSNNATLVNNVIYSSSGGITLAGTGTFINNSFNDRPITYGGETRVGGGMTLVLNAEHKNAGGYTIASGTRLMGCGAITGDGTVSLEGSNSKLCGSLSVKNLSCADGSMIGDEWNPVSAVVTGSIAAKTDGAKIAVTNGYLAIGRDCDTSGFSSAQLTIHESGLVLSNSLTVARLFANNATITLANGASFNIGDRSLDCSKVTIVLEDTPLEETTLLTGGATGGFTNFGMLKVVGLPVGSKIDYDFSAKRLFYTASSAVRKPTVDVLVAFDKGAQQYVAKKGLILGDFAAEQIAKMNDVLVTNKLDASYTYRLAGVCKVDDTYTDINATVSKIAGGEGALASIRAAREMYGADTVTLLVNTSGNVLGHSSQIDYKKDAASQHDEAFSVCAIDAVYRGSQHTMIHENAHTMGCGHAREQYSAEDLAKDPDRYSYGYYFKDANNNGCHTIMAYEKAGNWNPSWYFSTSSDEFGLVLGDATNDNARVLRETCSAVSHWRDAISPFEDDIIVQIAGTGEEVRSGRVFSGAVTIELSSPIPGATIYYTLDGSLPDEKSPVYSAASKISVDASCTLRAFAQLKTGGGGGSEIEIEIDDDDFEIEIGDSPISEPETIETSAMRTVKLVRIDELLTDTVWYTSDKFPWSSENGLVRSFNHTDYSAANKKATMPLKTTVEGPTCLSFEQKSFFMGKSEDSGNFSHFEVLVDDSPAISQTDCVNEWTKTSVYIPSGTHEVTIVYSQRSAKNNYGPGGAGSYDNKTSEKPESDDAVWIKNVAFEQNKVFYIPAGETNTLEEVQSDANVQLIAGEGTLYCGSTLPNKDYSLTNEKNWNGTVAFRGFNSGNYLKDFGFELYGNAKSKIQLTNCSVPYIKNNDATFAGTIVLVSDGVEGHSAFSTSNGYSSNYNVFGVLEGDGSMSYTGNPSQGYVFNVATNFTGAIDVNVGDGNTGRRIVFGNVSAMSDIPSQPALITVKSGATASIGARWFANHGVNIAGTLLVKGSGAKLDCSATAAVGLTLTDGATIKFDSADAKLAFEKKPAFSSGPVYIAFTDGVAPANDQTLISWPSAPGGTFELANSDGWELKSSDTGLAILKTKTDIGEDGATITRDEQLQEWMSNRGLDDDQWTQFLDGTAANGYELWQCYVLGLDDTENPNDKLDANIEIKDGKVTVTTAEGARDLEGVAIWTTLYGSETLVSPLPLIKKEKGTAIEMPVGTSGFYKVEVSIEAD